MTRPLVLTTEGARHPLRRMLPPFVAPAPGREDDSDKRLFGLSFAAFFVCFYTFIF